MHYRSEQENFSTNTFIYTNLKYYLENNIIVIFKFGKNIPKGNCSFTSGDDNGDENEVSSSDGSSMSFFVGKVISDKLVCMFVEKRSIILFCGHQIYQ